MKNVIRIISALCGVLLLAACAESPTEPEWEPTYAGQWGSEGSGNGEFQGPFGVAVAANGDVYVVDADNHRIQYFTPTGSFLGKWGTRGTGDGQFDNPGG
ncbi:MAG: hypothetical protein GTN49_06010 [candidate division Zixibacteria bacterium]|nr:hypothetical protein [candidate division Zixibacteria bacterium]